MSKKNSVRISVTLSNLDHSKLSAIAKKKNWSVAATAKILLERAIAIENEKD